MVRRVEVTGICYGGRGSFGMLLDPTATCSLRAPRALGRLASVFLTTGYDGFVLRLDSDSYAQVILE